MTVSSSRLIARPPLRVRYGPGSLGYLGREAERLGLRRPLVLHGASISRRLDLREEIAASLGSWSGVDEIGWFDKVAAHSPVHVVRAAVTAMRGHRSDGLVALGGGSAVVTARAAAILAAEGDGISRLSTRRGADGALHSPRLARPKLPLLVLPTTPSTAFGKAGAAVTEAGQRYAMFDPKTRASAIIVDPMLLTSAPESLIRDASLNAYAMAAEGVMSLRAHPFADADLGHALRLLADRLPLVGAIQEPPTLRTALCLCALLVGQGTDTTGGGAVAALSHTLGHRYPDVHNGRADAVLLPHGVEAVGRHAPQHVENLAAIMSVPTTAVVDHIREAIESTAPTSRLRDLGVPADDLAGIAADALNDFATTSSPFLPTEERLLEILNAAW